MVFVDSLDLNKDLYLHYNLSHLKTNEIKSKRHRR